MTISITTKLPRNLAFTVGACPQPILRGRRRHEHKSRQYANQAAAALFVASLLCFALAFVLGLAGL